MSRNTVFSLFFLAVFLQAGAYGLTFMLPKLFASFDANEKVVGKMLFMTAIATIIAVYYSGHLSDRLGRVQTLGLACLSIAISLFLYASATSVGLPLILASILLGGGWGLTYALPPVVLTRLVNSQERVRYFAALSIFVMAGFGLSPVLASVLENAGFSIRTTFHIVAALCAIAGVIFFVLVTPIRSNALNPAPEAKSRLSLGHIKSIIKSRALTSVTMVCLGASVFAGLNNFQTVFAEARGLNYSTYFLTYTLTVVAFRILLVRFTGGARPYRTIAFLQAIMCASAVLFLVMGGNQMLYVLFAILFGIGYGASYPILVAMAANDADDGLVPQTLQVFALTYFIGIFGFPLIAGWMIVEVGTSILLVTVAVLAAIEASMAAKRGWS